VLYSVQNEDTLKKCVADYQNKMKKLEEKYQSLKKQAEEKLEVANAEIERVKKSSDSELCALQASLRKSEMTMHSLELSVEQKTKEVAELTNICDELIAKVNRN
jgi:chromosome segregation ATPase